MMSWFLVSGEQKTIGAIVVQKKRKRRRPRFQALIAANGWPAEVVLSTGVRHGTRERHVVNQKSWPRRATMDGAWR
eukprot:s1634_g8.t1